MPYIPRSSASILFAVSTLLQAFVNIGTQGLGNASGIVAGQNLWAGLVKRAREAVLWALGYVTAAKLVVIGLLFTFPEIFLSIFNDDPELLRVGSTWLRIMLLGYFAMGPAQVLIQSFQISGDTVMGGKIPGSVTGVEDAPWWDR